MDLSIRFEYEDTEMSELLSFEEVVGICQQHKTKISQFNALKVELRQYFMNDQQPSKVAAEIMKMVNPNDHSGKANQIIVDENIYAKWKWMPSQQVTFIKHFYDEFAKGINNVTLFKNCSSLTEEIRNCKSFKVLNELNNTIPHMTWTFYQKVNGLIANRNIQYPLNQMIASAKKWVMEYSTIEKRVVQDLFEVTIDDDDNKCDDPNISRLKEIEKNMAELNSKLTGIAQQWNYDKERIFEEITELRDLVNKKAEELCPTFDTWDLDEVIEWLMFIDPMLILNEEEEKKEYDDRDMIEPYELCRPRCRSDIVEKLQMINLNGSTLRDLNDSILILIGIEEPSRRKLILKCIDALFDKYGGHKYTKAQLCCICMMNEVNTCLVPCGHLCYCDECGQKSFDHTDNCPICRKRILTIVTTFKAGSEKV